MNLSEMFHKPRLVQSTIAFARRFAAACEGIMAVEFALILAAGIERGMGDLLELVSPAKPAHRNGGKPSAARKKTGRKGSRRRSEKASK